MLSQIDLDIVSIAVPPQEQTKIIYTCLKKSISIFAEKPLSITIAESKKILRLQKKNKVPCTIDFIFPEIYEWIAVKKILDLKNFGNIKNIDIDLNYQSYSNLIKENSWKNNIKKGGGILHHIICHIFYYIEWFHKPIKSVSAYLYSEKNYKYSGHTNALILLKFKDETTAVIKASNNSNGINEHIIRFFNEKGTIILQNKKKDWVNGFSIHSIKRDSSDIKKIFVKKENFKKNSDTRFLPVSRIVNRLVDWIIYKKKTSPDFYDGHRVQCLIDTTIKSNKLNGKWINLK